MSGETGTGETGEVDSDGRLVDDDGRLARELELTRRSLDRVLKRLDNIDKRAVRLAIQARKEAKRAIVHRIATALLVIAVVIGFLLYWEAQSREERICQAVNESNAVLLNVLESLAQPRDDDQPGEFEERQRLLDQVSPFVQPINC